MNEVAEPAYLRLQLAVLALIVIDLQLNSLLINIVNPLLVLPTNSQRSQITEMQLNNVITHPSHDLQVVNSNCLLQIDQHVKLARTLPHLLHLEQRIFSNEEGFKVEQTHQILIVLVVLRNLLLHRLHALPHHVVKLLPELKNKVSLLRLIVTAHHARRQQETVSVLVLETLTDKQKRKRSRLLISLVLLHRPHSLLQQQVVTVLVHLLRQVQVHIVEIYSSRVLVIVHWRHCQGRDRQSVRHSFGKLHELML